MKDGGMGDVFIALVDALADLLYLVSEVLNAVSETNVTVLGLYSPFEVQPQAPGQVGASKRTSRVTSPG